MIYLLYSGYLAIFCFLLQRLSFFKSSGLSKKSLTVLFLLRVLTSVFATYYILRTFPRSDTLVFHEKGIAELQLLFTFPKTYFSNLFFAGYDTGYSGFFATSKSFWNNLGSSLVLKMLSLFNIFSFSNIYINTLFFNFLVFSGLTGLYRVFATIYQKNRFAIIFSIFLLPSALFFSSVIHKDGLALFALSVVFYQLFLMFRNGFSWKRFICATFFLLLVFGLRSFVFFALVPALVGWYLSRRFPAKTPAIFSTVYIVAIVLFFISGKVSPQLDLPGRVSERRQAFLDISAGSNTLLSTDTLGGGLKGFLAAFPVAADHAFFRPHITELSSAFKLPFALEILLFELCALLFFFSRKKNPVPDPFSYTVFFFGLTMFLIIGYTIPVLGAIVRYRSIFFIFIMTPIVGNINWKNLSIFKLIK